MAIKFNADEVFEMAEQIERNGANFYQKAAGLPNLHNMRDLLLELSDWELQHEKLFARMREEVSASEKKPTAYDPENEAALYLRAMADGKVFDIKTEPADLLSGNESEEDVVNTAIGLEKDSIVFYLGIQEMTPEDLGKEKIDNVIKEEMRHVRVLSDLLK